MRKLIVFILGFHAKNAAHGLSAIKIISMSVTLCIVYSSITFACEKHKGIYSTVSESEWHFRLELNSDCSFLLKHHTHYWDENDKIVNIDTQKTGVWIFEKKQVILEYSNGESDKFTYYNSHSYEEFGGDGCSAGLLGSSPKFQGISFWKFPKDN